MKDNREQILKRLDNSEKLNYAYAALKLDPQSDVSYHIKIILHFLDELNYFDLVQAKISEDPDSNYEIIKAIWNLQQTIIDVKMKKLRKRYWM